MNPPQWLAEAGEVPLDDPLAEALRLIDRAEGQGLQLRLMGGLAFHAVVPTWRAPVERTRRDIDLATRSHDRRGVADLLASAGYEPDRQYNALYGHKQLYFVDTRRGRPVDVLVDRLEMCHTFEFADRLQLEPRTLPLADLLLSKLQVVKINRKDLLDSLILLQSRPLAADDAGVINVRRITDLTSTDWGWWRTVTGNLERLAAFMRDDLVADELATDVPPPFDPIAQVTALRSAIDMAPKSFGWKVRARLGDRVRWYEEPEEIGHGGG